LNEQEKEGNMTSIELATLSANSVRTTGLDAIVPALSWMPRIEEHPSWETFAQLRVTLRAGVALNRFQVRDLLSLKEGQVFESLSPDTEDVPLMVGQVQLGWSEFEIVDQRMALRLTRLG
jgi:flagellar motor switch/type III secretory pathway protein FliN